MATFSGLGIGLSFVFGCILLGLAAELYYILYWKKRITTKEKMEEEYTCIAAEIPHAFCWKHPNALWKSNAQQEQIDASTRKETSEANGVEKDLESSFGEDSVDLELMRMHNLAGPPRFLFPIKEESREDFESEDGRSNRSRNSSRTRSLSDVMISVDTSILCSSPLASPSIKIPWPLDSYNNNGFNPLFESISEGELNRLRSSPPPKFKFLRDAEEKLMKKLMEEAEKKRVQSSLVNEETNGSLLGICREKEMLLRQLPLHRSTPSQVLPLNS